MEMQPPSLRALLLTFNETPPPPPQRKCKCFQFGQGLKFCHLLFGKGYGVNSTALNPFPNDKF